MKLSELFDKNIMEAFGGWISTNFKLIKKRRFTFFFEEIGSRYIKECEKNGYSDITSEIAKKWISLYFNTLVPKPLMKRSLKTFFLFVKTMWSVGKLIEDVQVIKYKNKIKIITTGEGTTRDIGKNNFMVGFYNGILSAFYGKEVKPVRVKQTKEICEYEFSITKTPFVIKGKPKDYYDRLNQIEITGDKGMKDALKLGLFQLSENNRIYFRGKTIVPIESTLYHIIGNEGLMIDKIPHISKDYFKEIINKETTRESRLVLLKNLLQTMGWGIVKIIDKNKKIIFEIRNPPYGLQKEKDNWDFLIHVILGYLWLIDEKFKIENIEYSNKLLRVIFSV